MTTSIQQGIWKVVLMLFFVAVVTEANTTQTTGKVTAAPVGNNQQNNFLSELFNIIRSNGSLSEILNIVQSTTSLSEILNGLQSNDSTPDILGLFETFQTTSLSDILNGLQANGSTSELSELLQIFQPLVNQGINEIFNNPDILATLLPLLSSNITDGELTTENLEELLSSGLALARAAAGLYMTSNGVGQKCQSDLVEIVEGISSGEVWALQILDSYGKPERGLLQGDINWMGNYQQCLDFYITPFNAYLDPVNPTNFESKYCRVGLPLTQLLPAEFQMLGQSVTIGSCLPQSCLASDITGIFAAVQALVNITEPMLPVVDCVEDREVETNGFIALCILAILAFMVLIGTAYDIIAIQMQLGKSTRDNEKIIPDKAPVNEYVSADANGASDIQTPIYTDEKSENNGHTIHVPIAYINRAYDDVPDVTSRAKSSSGFDDISHQTKVNKTNDMTLPNPKMATGALEKIVLSFSVYTNGVKLLSTNQGSGSLGAVNGIRFLSMAWVILGHSLAFAFEFSNNIYVYGLQRAMGRWTFLGIVNATFSVDSFFTLSGLLVAYLTLRELKKVGGAKKLNWFMFYFHRFWRLTPAYMLVLMVGYVIYPLVVDGPMRIEYSLMGDCKKYWWTNLLYVNNLVADDDTCMGWSWYLANDMQFYVLSPLLLLPLFYNMYAGIASCLVFLSVTIGLNAHITYSQEYNAQSLSPFLTPQDETGYFRNLYIPCYTRMGPYIIGAFTGYLLYKWDCKCKIHKVLNLILWLLALGIACGIVYSVYNEWDSHIFTLSESTAYWALSRTGWGVAISWIVFACATGNGGWINEVLSWKPFIPLGRLSYCAYLIHPLLMYGYHQVAPQQFQFTDFTLCYLFVGHLVFSYGGAFLTSLVFESPMMGLEKAIFKKK